MSIYKEIQLNLERNLINQEDETIEGQSFQLSNQVNQKETKKRGLTYNFSNEIIYLTVKDNLLQITSMSTQLDNSNKNNQSSDLINHYYFRLPSLILDSITVKEENVSANSYSITIFTDNGHIQSFIKQSNANFHILRGSYQDSLKIVSVEYIYQIQSEQFYSFGSSTGHIYIMALTEDNGRLALTHKHTINPNASNRLFRVFQSTAPENGINSMKYIGNNLISFIDTKFTFGVYNLMTKRIIYSTGLISNSNSKEDLLSSKILSNVIDFSKQEIEIYRTKIFNVLVYLEYSNTYEVVSFELWFKNIPNNSLINLQQQSNGLSSKQGELFNLIELGNDVSIKNQRVYVLRGHLVDMDIQDNKLWIMVENKRRIMNHLPEGKFEDKYSIGIISLTQDANIEEEGNLPNDIQWNSDNSLDYQEKSLKNIINILEQINSNTCLSLKDKNNICLSMLSNDEYFNKSTLIKVFNQVFKQKYQNKTEIINMLKQQSNNLGLDEALIIPLIQDELKSNDIISFGWFNTQELQSLSLIRAKGLSLIKPVGFFEKLDFEISQHEYNIRNILFNQNSSFTNSKNRGFEEIIEEYALIECKYNKSNALYIILALLRIYLTEIYLLIVNENYLSNLFNHNPYMSIDSFIQKIFDDNITIQYNNLGFLDFIHSIIKDLINNNIKIIMDGINNIINEYSKIKDMTESLMTTIPSSIDDDSKYGCCNNLYCEIISTIASNKIASMYHIARDIVSFSSWQRVYSEYERIDESIINNMDEDAIRLIFTETFTHYIIASSSAVVSNYTIGKNSKTFLEELVRVNITKYKVPMLKQKSNQYIDILIHSLMPDMSQKEGMKYSLYQKIYRYKELNLLSILNHIQNDPNSIQYICIDLLCQAKLNTQHDWNRIVQSVNNYYTKLIEISQRDNGEYSFTKINNLFLAVSNNNNNSSSIVSNDNDSILIKGFKLIEREFKDILNREEMNKFYLHSFSWIYPSLPNRNNLMRKSSNNSEIDNRNSIDRSYLINYFKSVIEIDFKYALSSYNTIKQNFNSSELMNQITELFANYLIDSFKINVKNEFLATLIANNFDLLCQICQILEAKCFINLDNTELISFLNINAINEPTVLSSSKHSSINFFKLLFSIYCQMKDYQAACLISYNYSKVLDNAILTDNFSIEMMIGLYQEKISALNNAIQMMKKCKDSNQCFLYDRNNANPSLSSSAIVKPVSIECLIKEKRFCEVKVVLLKKYETTKELKEAINEEMLSKIKRDNCLLNLIFQMRMYDIVIGMNMISFVNETQGKILIYNLMSNLLMKSSGNDNENNNTNSNNQQDIDYDSIKVFLDQIKETQYEEYAYYAIEALLYFNKDYQVNELINVLKVNNSVKLLHLMLKYSQFADIVNLMAYMYEQNEQIPIYIREHIKALSENNYKENDQLALRKCKEIINQLDSTIRTN